MSVERSEYLVLEFVAILRKQEIEWLEGFFVIVFAPPLTLIFVIEFELIPLWTTIE
jgi:hypothetical protein